VFKLNAGVTMEQFQAFMASGQGEPPGVEHGGMQGLTVGNAGWLHLDLEPGNYVALCFIPDSASGKLHAELGMVMPFSVK